MENVFNGYKFQRLVQLAIILSLEKEEAAAFKIFSALYYFVSVVMARFSFPSCCRSCSCFSFSSTPDEEAIAGPFTTSRASQQPPNAGPSTTSPSSSQPSQQPANPAPSIATSADLESFLHKFNDISELNELIHFIEELLKIAVSYPHIRFA